MYNIYKLKYITFNIVTLRYNGKYYIIMMNDEYADDEYCLLNYKD